MFNREKEGETIPSSPWSPFCYPIFKMLWIASTISNIGTWLHDLGAAWLMTILTNDPLWVALVQAITALSIFLLALPGGALADILDRRAYLISLQTFMMVVAGSLAVTTFLGETSPELLLFLTFCLGIGTALSTPTWLALMSELVPSKDLPPAVTLIGLSINLSRAIGPALGGIIIAAAGPAAVFAINALSFFGIIIALFAWHHPPNENILPAERLFGAMRAAVRYVRGSPALQTILLKSSAFFVFASSVWALLPLVARSNLHSGPMGYGFLFAFFGIGAVLSTILLPRLREKLNCDQLIVIGAMGFAITAFILSLSNNFYFAGGGMVLGGMSWTLVLATLTTLVQQVVSSWVRARALAIFLAVFFGGMAAGSILWGWIASHFTISIALFVSALGLMIANFLTYLFTSGQRLILDLTPSNHLPLPHTTENPRYEQGPVMVTIEYSVPSQKIESFSLAMEDLRHIRIRDGAFFWTLFQDIENRKRFVECFMIESWLEHLRQHERASISDRDVQDKVSGFHDDKTPPRVTHLIAYNRPKKKRFKIF